MKNKYFIWVEKKWRNKENCRLLQTNGIYFTCRNTNRCQYRNTKGIPNNATSWYNYGKVLFFFIFVVISRSFIFIYTFPQLLNIVNLQRRMKSEFKTIILLHLSHFLGVYVRFKSDLCQTFTKKCSSHRINSLSMNVCMCVLSVFLCWSIV